MSVAVSTTPFNNFYLKLTYCCIKDCVISTNRDLTELQPLLLKPGTWSTFGNDPYYLPSNREGEIIFKPGEEIILHCPGTTIRADGVTINSGILTISCDSHKTFKIHPEGNILPFKLIECTTPAKHIVRRTEEKCNTNNDLLEIGFPLNDGRFITQISVCFDSEQKRTFYTKFQMTSSIEGFQTHVARQMFNEGGSFFNLGVPVEQCYYIPKQRHTINRQLNLAENSIQYIDKGTTIFTRGHLAAKGDFVFGPQQTATFYWVNAAPQWARLNNDNWNELEKSLRQYASNIHSDFLVYTGTHEIAHVGNVDLFLHCDSVNHIPVPKYFWKVVYEPQSQAGVAFIGLNNPFDHSEQTFCKDVCDQLRWQITWERKNRNLGFSFCCEVDDFRRTIEFPRFTTKGLLSRRDY